jgi:hypothetical protein
MEQGRVGPRSSVLRRRFETGNYIRIEGVLKSAAG